MLYVEISNSTESKPIIKDGHFLTSKEDGKTHGYGTKNIYKVVRKYNASVNFNAENNMYSLTCIFPIAKT